MPALKKFNTIVRPYSWSDVRDLAASVAEVHTVPSGATIVEINANADIWVNIGGTAAIPGADVTDGSASKLVAYGTTAVLILESAASIGVICASAGKVNLIFYQ